jgi:hypothetical protein
MRDRPDVEVFDDGLFIASGALTAAVARMELSNTTTAKSWFGSIVWVNPLEKRDLSGQNDLTCVGLTGFEPATT